MVMRRRKDLESEALRRAALGSDPQVPRQPKGVKTGGQFAREVASESEITLEETSVAPGYEPDGSKAFEERTQQREAAEREEAAQRDREVLAELEQSLRTPSLADEPVGLQMAPPPQIVAPSPKKVEPPVVKLGGSDTTGEGSWIFPPTPTRDVMKLANYWATVKLEDGALVNVERADRFGRDLELWRTETNKEIYRGGGKWPRKRRKAFPEDWEKELDRREAAKDRGEQVALGRGLMWPHTQIRDMVRIGAFWCQIQSLSSEDQEKANRIVFEMSRGERITAAEAGVRWGLAEIHLAFFNRWVY